MYQKFKNCLNRLSIVNETLEKLGTPKNYIKLRKRIIWLIIGWIVSILFTNILDSLWFFIHIPRCQIIIAICLPLIFNHSHHINVLHDFKYMILLRYIESQFGHVNQHIQKLTELKKRQVRRAWATSTLPLINRHMIGNEASKKIIWILMHVHRELCSISCELNKIFGLQMVTQVIVFQVITIQLIDEFYEYDIVTKINDQPLYKLMINFLNTYIWATIVIVKMIVFNYICEGVCTKANRAELFLNKITNLIFDIETQENIMQFLLQILQNPLRISGLGLFYFGYKFIYECIHYIGTIIIFALQSHS